jgi:hypothetical protein
MGMATNIMFFTICASIVLYMFGADSLLTSIVSCVQHPSVQIGYDGAPLTTSSCSLTGIFGTGNIWDIFNLVLIGGIMAGIVAVAGAMITVGPDKTFSVIGLFFFAFVSLPIDLFKILTGLPQPLAIGIQVLMVVSLIVGLISWQKGGADP